MEGEESRLRYVDSQVKTVYRSKASKHVGRCTNRPPTPMCAPTRTHDMTRRMFVMVPVHDSMTLAVTLR